MSWADIPERPGYQANSETGEVRRLQRSDRTGRVWPELILTGWITDNGYRRYLIRGKHIDGHRAVLSAHIGPCPPGMEGCHNNGQRLDNRLENLRWGTRRSNTNDKIIHGTHPFASRQKCSKGHEYTEENTQIAVRGHHRIRICRTCNRNRMRQRRSQ